MKKKLFSAFTVLALAFGLSPAQPASAGVQEITIALWDEVQAPVIQQTIDKFNNLYKSKYKATIVRTPWGEFWNKLDASLPTTKGPDVTWMNVFLPKYVNGKTLEPLDPFIKKDGMNLSQYIPGRVAAFNYGGSQYALPKGMDAVFVAYNKAIFKKYNVTLPKTGWTWEDMVASATQLRAGMDAAKSTEFPIAMELDLQPSYANFLHQDGADFLSLDKKTTLAGSATGLGTIQKVVDLMDNKLMFPYTTLSETKGTDLFISGKAGLAFIGSWKAQVLEESSLGKAKDIGLIQMPKGKLNNASVAGGLGYAMSAKSSNKEGAWKLIKYLTSWGSMSNEASNNIEVPARADAQRAYASSFQNIDAKVILKALKTASPFPHNGLPATLKPLQDSVAVAFSGKSPVSTSVKKGAEDTQKLLDDVNK